MDSLWCVCKEFSQGGESNQLDFTEWGMEVSLYNPCSGDTHLLNLFPFEIFQFLRLKSASLFSVSEHMAALCDENNDEKWKERVLILLKQLEELELIEYQ